MNTAGRLRFAALACATLVLGAAAAPPIAQLTVPGTQNMPYPRAAASASTPAPKDAAPAAEPAAPATNAAPAGFGAARVAAAAPSSAAVSTDATRESVGPGDVLRITVFRNPDLTTEARVSEGGSIAFPLIGEVNVTGLTPGQVGTRIADKLKSGRFVVNPEVNVSVGQVNSRQVAVLGNVTRPGRYPLEIGNSKLTDLLATAGGVAGPGSDLVTVVTRRDGNEKKIEVDLPAMFRQGDLSQNIDMFPGDTIFVHRAPMVYIYGEVQKAGAYRLEPNMTVMQAIAMGGGVTLRGTERGVKIHRRGPDGKVQKLDVQLTDKVQVDDVVYVKEALF